LEATAQDRQAALIAREEARMGTEALQGRSRVPEMLYFLLAAIGLIGTQVQLPAYLPAGFVPGTALFWKDALANAAGKFLVVDIFVLGTAVFIWMFGEARRLAMRGAWIYWLGSLLIGISLFVPLFFAMRERRLRSGATGEWRLEGGDWIAVLLSVALCVGAAVYSLFHIPAWQPM
jgi:hypothetical protein